MSFAQSSSHHGQKTGGASFSSSWHHGICHSKGSSITQGALDTSQGVQNRRILLKQANMINQKEKLTKPKTSLTKWWADKKEQKRGSHLGLTLTRPSKAGSSLYPTQTFTQTKSYNRIHFSTTASYITNLHLEARLNCPLMWGYVLGSLSTYFMSLYWNMNFT